jgi:hypothetical protein
LLQILNFIIRREIIKWKNTKLQIVIHHMMDVMN